MASSSKPPSQHKSLLDLLPYFQRFAGDSAFVEDTGYRRHRLTYRELSATSSKFASRLRAAGIVPGDRVVLWAPNSAEWVSGFWGIICTGAAVVPLDWVGTPEFACSVVRNSGAKLAIVAPERAQSNLGIPVLALDSLEQGSASREKSTASSHPIELDRKSLAEIVFTSGTTSEPKGVAISHGNILANLEPIEREILRFRKYERVVHPIRFLNLLPLSHVFGQFLGLFLPPVMGGEVHFQESLSPAEIARAIRRERISVLVAVPRVLDALRRKIETDAAQLHGAHWLPEQLRATEGERFWKRWWRFRSIHRQLGWKFWAIISGGAALSPETEEFWNRIGIAVIQGYGLTETTSMISLNHPFAMGRGSIGKVLPGREVRLAQDGEILVRGESVAAGYWKNAQAAATAEDGGWFHTGDIGEFDAEGNLYFKGRKKNVIVTPAGMNIYPEDLEAALRHQPGVRDCVVIPLASQGDTEAAAILLLEDPDRDPQSIIAQANSHLAEYQRIRRWFVWPDPDFPRTSTGKPKIAEIAARVSVQIPDSSAGRPNEIAKPADGDLSAILSRITGRSMNSLQPSARLEADLGLSSLDRVELLSALEDRYQLSLNEAAISGDTAVADLERLIAASQLTPSGAATVSSASPTSPTNAETPEEFPSGRKVDVFPRWTQRAPATWIRAAVYTLLTWPATHLLAHPRVRGRENLRGYRRPLLIVCNHVTPDDIGFIAAALPARYRYKLTVAMAGERLRSYRFPPKTRGFFGRLLDRTNYILVTLLFNVFPLPRVSGFRESFRYAGESVDRGFSVVVFPEGRTTPDGKIQPFRAGIGLLASNLRIPVLPIHIAGLYELREAHRIWAGWNRVRVSIGAPVEFSAADSPEEIARRLEWRVAEMSAL